MENAYEKEKVDEIKYNGLKIKCTPESKSIILDCCMHFESFTLLSKSLLDLLSKLYPKTIYHKQDIKSRSFTKLKYWIIKTAPAQNFHTEIIEYYRDNTKWFDSFVKIRDELAHNQGYIPVISKRYDGKLAISFSFMKDDHKYNENIDDMVYTYLTGINDLLEFTDNISCKYFKLNQP